MNARALESAITVRRSPFEESLLGGPVLRLDLGAGALEFEIDAVVAQGRESGVRLISVRLPSADQPGAAALTKAGFRKIEQLVTWRRSIMPVPKRGHLVDLAREEDHAACIDIGRSAFTTDRYHADPKIPNAIADALKARWIENSLNGRADVALVARDNAGGVAGFNLIVDTGTDPMIDLIAVAERHRSQGIGRALVVAALDHYRGRAEAMVVGTQSQNTASMALYPALGFICFAEQATFHWTP